MARFWSALSISAAVFLPGGVLSWGQVSSNLFCGIQPTPQTLIRGEGAAELVGDIGLLCSAPSPSVGSPIPTYNLTVTLNSPLTSRVLADHLSEALLIIDEAFPSQPNPATAARWPDSGRPQNLCRAVGGTACEILETGITDGTPGGDYDGSSGHYNTFEGVVSGFNSVSFLGVPISGEVSLRIINIRADAADFLTPPFTSAQIEAKVTTDPGASAGWTTVALAEKSMTVTQTAPVPVAGTPYSSLSVTFSENFGFPAAFRTLTDFKNPGPQNVPGFLYNSESGFWDKLIPPLGVGPLGVANHGTRLMIHFSGYPAGINIVAPSAAYLETAAGKGTLNTGAVAYVATDANGNSAGGPQALTTKAITVTTNSDGEAWLTYEVMSSLPTISESVTIPVAIESQAGGTVTGSYGPLVSAGTWPIPRFVQE